jgi:hypothetical protein
MGKFSLKCKVIKLLLLGMMVICSFAYVNGKEAVDSLGQLCASPEDIDYSFLNDSTNLLPPPPPQKGYNTSQIILDFWQKTAASRTRDPLFLVPTKRFTFDNDGIICYPFFNCSNKLSIDPEAIFNFRVADYIVEWAENNLKGHQPQQMLDTLTKTLPYVHKMTSQERRMGILLSGGFTLKRFVFQADLPIFWVERNFWLKNAKDRNEFKNIVSQLDGLGKNNVIKTSAGLGDLKLKCGYKVLDNPRVQMALGVEGIFPTSRLFFHQPRHIYDNNAFPQSELIRKFVSIAQDILIKPKTGTGHWGAGLFGEMKIHLIQDKLDFWGKTSIDFFLNQKERRYTPKYALFQIVGIEEFLSQCSEKYIPKDSLARSLFPDFTNITVNPGNIFNTTVGVDWMFAKGWKLGLGYDFYWQQREKILKIDRNKKYYVSPNNASSSIVQHKVLGELCYTMKGKKHDWMFGLGGDVTWASKGTGKDWTLFGKIGFTF